MPSMPAFIWGAATSSFQIEGYPLADGAAPSIWREFCGRRGAVAGGDTGEVACDHYHRYPEDLELMKELGIHAYRFSVSWPRLFPEPGRAAGPQGLDFYERLVDGLLERGIIPFLTLFHWETPCWLERQGGFTCRSAVEYLQEYGRFLFSRLGDRVKHWITVNEPMVYAVNGYGLGKHAPGRRGDLRGLFHAAHHLLLAHARLTRIFHEEVKGGRVGIASHLLGARPARPSNPRDREAAAFLDLLLNRFFLDPVTRGGYPEAVLKRFGRFLPLGFEGDLEEMNREPMDFLGVNYYTSRSWQSSCFVPCLRAREKADPSRRRSAMWEIDPQGLYGFLIKIRDDYGNLPCYITENGFPLPEAPGRDPLDDGERITYLEEHIRAALAARREGVDLRGFFVWSLLDNFEWEHGYAMRFGLIRVDFNSLQRTVRKSGFWYRDLIRESSI